MRNQKFMKPGDKVNVIGSYSGVMCHMGLAGRPVTIELLRKEYSDGYVCHSAQVYRDGKMAGAPVTTGEAGIYGNGTDDNPFYTYEAEPGETGDADPRQVQADMTAAIKTAMGDDVKVITNLGLNF